MIRENSHLAFIRLLPCCNCGCRGNIQAAHIRNGTDGGTGLKPSDCYVVPLCDECHSLQHQIGEANFWDKRNPKRLAENLFCCQKNQRKAMKILLKWRMNNVK